MKDVVENRKRIGSTNKLRLAWIALRENGPVWCFLLLIYYTASTVAHRSFQAQDGLRKRRHIPGLNSPTLNKAIWETWDWSVQGDEWTQSPQWKDSVRHAVLERELPTDADFLEIGPGAGRWTEYLLERARRYEGIDISNSCVEYCRNRFGDDSRATFTLGSGHDLVNVADNSIDAIWSFDAFVHINATEVEGYIGEFARVLRPNGVAVIHHGGVGGAMGGWRSNLTAKAFHDMVCKHGLLLERSFDQWSDAGMVHTVAYGDRIAVIRKSKVEAR
jgi:SAM-dependent methyltransferase